MSEKYRALIVILILASAVFAFVKPLATTLAISEKDFVRRRNYWFYITIAAFLSPYFWIFIFVVGFLVYKADQKENNKIALFFFLFLALPQNKDDIPGFGIVEHIFALDYLKLITIIILVPLCIKARREAIKNGTPSFASDYILLLYVALTLGLKFQYDTFTGVLRALTMWCLDILIPYYAISRSVKGLKGFRDVAMSFAIAAMIVSAVGVFEFSKTWLLYSSLGDAWGVSSISIYLSRADLLRANATSGQAIILGYVIAVGIGLYLYLRHSVPSTKLWVLGFLLLIAGEISPLSKGPWVGAVAMLLLFMALSPARLSHAAKLLFVLPLLSIGLLTTDMGTKIMGFLPFVGTVDEGSSAYRQLLFDTSIRIIMDNPFFGSIDFLDKMENLRQGQGIIDLVNTFLIVALNTGLVGLGLFLSFYGMIMWGILRTKQLADTNVEVLALRNSLLSVMCGNLIIMASVSPIFHASILYIGIGALGVAYQAFMVSSKNDQQFHKTHFFSNL